MSEIRHECNESVAADEGFPAGSYRSKCDFAKFPVKLSEDYDRRGYLPGLEAAVDLHPVEYAVAVDRYLGQAALGVASRRVYRVSLASWAWPLVGKPTPAGPQRRGALAPVVPLALLEDPGTTGRLASALA